MSGAAWPDAVLKRDPPRRMKLIAVIAATSVLAILLAVWLPGEFGVMVVGTNSPELSPREYDMPPDQTLQVAAAVANRVLGWNVKPPFMREGDKLQMSAPGWLGMRACHLLVLVEPMGRNSRVKITAVTGGGMASCVGAKHIRELQDAMDRQLPPAH